MNRIILFRGKRTDNREWVEGFYLTIGERAYIICEAGLDCADGENTDLYAVEWYEVYPETVCQYTGLTDKNGRKIFEGDIVKHFNRPEDDEKYVIGCIKWNQDSCKFVKENEDGAQYNINSKCIYEVIGNIFDNPKPLEARNEIN